jgi:ferredoxin
MRVELDQHRCQGHNRCYALAPEIFDVDDFGTAILLNDGIVPKGLEGKAALAIANCPEFAISEADANSEPGAPPLEVTS